MLTPEQQVYVNKYKPKRLTFDGVNDLYQTIFGARTIANALEMEALQSVYFARLQRARKVLQERLKNDPQSLECLERGIVNEQCIEAHGCSIELW